MFYRRAPCRSDDFICPAEGATNGRPVEPKAEVAAAWKRSPASRELPATEGMEHRYLGTSGLMVSEMALGSWITHAGQIEERSCRRVCLPPSMPGSPRSTPPTSTQPQGRGAQPAAQRLEDLHQVYWPDRTQDERPRPVAQASWVTAARPCAASCTSTMWIYIRPTGSTAKPHAGKTLRAFDDLVPGRQSPPVGVSRWRARIEGGSRDRRGRWASTDHLSSQPQYRHALQGHRGRVIPPAGPIESARSLITHGAGSSAANPPAPVSPAAGIPPRTRADRQLIKAVCW